MPLSINNYSIDNKEKDGENGAYNTRNSNKNTIAVNSTCHWESGMCVQITGMYQKERHR
jgi:hypothetical protein